MNKTRHSEQRMQQRGIRHEEIDLVLNLTEPDYRGRHFFGRNACEALERIIDAEIRARRKALKH